MCILWGYSDRLDPAARLLSLSSPPSWWTDIRMHARLEFSRAQLQLGGLNRIGLAREDHDDCTHECPALPPKRVFAFLILLLRGYRLMADGEGFVFSALRHSTYADWHKGHGEGIRITNSRIWSPMVRYCAPRGHLAERNQWSGVFPGIRWWKMQDTRGDH